MIISIMTLFSAFDINKKCNEKEEKLEKEIKELFEEIKQIINDNPENR